MKAFSAIIFFVVLIASVFASDKAAESVSVSIGLDVTKSDVTLNPAYITEFGAPPKFYSLGFRKCYYCKYACSTQFAFAAFSKELSTCINSCTSQDYCKEYVKPEYKHAPIARFATAWRPVNIPAELAVKLNLAHSYTFNGKTYYKPLAVPYPWMCATPVSWVTPEYKPEHAKVVLVTTPAFTVSPSSPINALRVYLTRKMMQKFNLIPYNGHYTIHGN
jgi:hypothetical protein